MNGHWTSRSTEDFLHKISSDFVFQIENRMDEEPLNQCGLAKRLGVSEGRVSQVLRNPGNLTLKNVVEYARVLGLKVAIVAYDDNDPMNRNGPINSQIFTACWKKVGKPNDFFALQEPATSIRTETSIRYVKQPSHYDISTTPDGAMVANFGLINRTNTTPDLLISI